MKKILFFIGCLFSLCNIYSQSTNIIIHNDYQKSFVIVDADTKDSLYASTNTLDSFFIADNIFQKRTLLVFIEQRFFHYIVLNASHIDINILEDNELSFMSNELNTQINKLVEEGRKIEDFDTKNQFFYAYHIQHLDLYLTLDKVYFDLLAFSHSRDSIIQMFNTLDEDLKQFDLWQKCYDLIYLTQTPYTLTMVEETTMDSTAQKKDTISIQLHYETGYFKLTDEHKRSINKVLLSVDENQLKSIQVIGHTDDVGSEEDNFLLAQKRVNQVAQYLYKINYFCDTVVRGEKSLLFENDIESQRKNNRLVEIVLKFSVKMDVGETLVMKNILFDGGTDKFLPESTPALEELLSFMTSNPSYHIDIQGHICCQNSLEDGGLSLARAVAVYDYLVENGIARERMTYQGFGGTRPLYQSLGDFKNRRVEIYRTK